MRLFRSRFVSWEDPVRNGSTFPVFVKSLLWALGVRAPLEEKWGWLLEVQGETWCVRYPPPPMLPPSPVPKVVVGGESPYHVRGVDVSFPLLGTDYSSNPLDPRPPNLSWIEIRFSGSGTQGHSPAPCPRLPLCRAGSDCWMCLSHTWLPMGEDIRQRTIRFELGFHCNLALRTKWACLASRMFPIICQEIGLVVNVWFPRQTAPQRKSVLDVLTGLGFWRHWVKRWLDPSAVSLWSLWEMLLGVCLCVPLLAS